MAENDSEINTSEKETENQVSPAPSESPEAEKPQSEEPQNAAGTPTKMAISMIDEMKSGVPALPLSQKNWSWPFFILVMVYIVVLAVVGIQQVGNAGAIVGTGPRVGFLLATFFIGSIFGVIIYNVGKGLGAKIAGYKLAYLCISGVCWDSSRAEKKWYFDGSEFLEIHSRYTSVDDRVDRDPSYMLLLGPVVWLVAFAALLVVGLVFMNSDPESPVYWGIIFGAAFSGDYFVYQICPFRQDYPSDIFSFISTRNPENRKAFNIYYINRGNEFADREMLVPDFEDYHTYWKAKTAIYLYRDHLYKNEIEEALKVFPLIHSVSRYLNEEEKGQVAGERLFILLLLNDRAGADNLFIELSKSLKSEVVRPTNTASFRTSLMISGLILNREDTAIENVKSMLKAFPKEGTSLKMSTEIKYYRLAYDRVHEGKPSFNLPAIGA